MAGLTDEQREALRQQFKAHGYDPDVAEQHITSYEKKMAESETPIKSVDDRSSDLANQKINDYDILKAPAAAGAAGGALYGAKKLYDSLTHKMQEAAPVKIEPKMYESQVPSTEPVLEPEAGSKMAAQKAAAPAANLTQQEQEMIARSEENKKAKEQIAERKATKEKIAEVQAKVAAEAPEGMRPNYKKSAANPIGPGGYNWLYGQLGENAPAAWEEQYGKRNVPYEQVRNEYSAAKAGPPTRAQMQSPYPGGTNTRPAYIPKYIQGSVVPGSLVPLAGTALGASLLLPRVSEAAQATRRNDPAMAAANAAEFLNLHPITAIANQLFGLSPEELQTLRTAKQAKLVGAGRGVAPPEDYLR